MVAELRKMLQNDGSPEVQSALKGNVAKGIQDFGGNWFQRIDYPAHNITSTSNHDWAYIDEGGLNTLGKRLTSREASILRPWPKWLYIKPTFPEVQGKSVLEIGSSNGFFSFRFAELGAKQVTGVEVLKRQHESSVWSKEVLGHQNVTFVNSDILFDLSIPKHDIVFLSEVHNHLLFPFYGLLRIISLAKEMVIFDTGVIDTASHTMNLHTGWSKEENRFIYHSFQISDGLITDFLGLIGVDSSKITRYKGISGDHILYKIDVRDLNTEGARTIYPEYLKRSLELEFSGFEQLQNQLKQTQRELDRSQAAVHQTQAEVAAMKTSKFWKLRTQWFKVKKSLGLKIDD
ncbi:bifunctional 2-polyprenyl-6-hydroxyphenol methylase/3-demethylubiquinol 3-O-methyltransferase UbiG [Leptolyngbya sp. FACHB-261]|uniref:class I SAM-dependent methyltransferase n=1 Tax=Leptolyngbya sp. FACHB-261 TaxID=2692806 RepID=UPI0016860FBC|nr:class I SAM-dependent methyltransferase [Leptolyngbya sp. FACHB-261]MBD2103185.1 DUF1698 domain-containing protein [Leptolyngbya sp. FACHB-261]